MLVLSDCFQDCLGFSAGCYNVLPHCEHANTSLLINLKSLGHDLFFKIMPHSLSFLLGHQLITCMLKCLLLFHRTLVGSF